MCLRYPTPLSHLGLLKAMLEGELKGDDSSYEFRLLRIHRTLSLYGKQLFEASSPTTLKKWAESLQELAAEVETRHTVKNGIIISADILSILCGSLVHYPVVECKDLFPGACERVLYGCKRVNKTTKMVSSDTSVWVVWSHSIRSCNSLLRVASTIQHQNMANGQRDDIFAVLQPLITWLVGLLAHETECELALVVPLLLPCLSNAIKLFPQRMKSYAAKVNRGCCSLLVSSSTTSEVRRLAACVLASLPLCTGDPAQWKSSLCNALAEAVKMLDRVRGKEQTSSLFSQAFLSHGLNLDLNQAIYRRGSSSPCPTLVCTVFSSLFDYAVLLLETPFPNAVVHIPFADILGVCEEVMAISHSIAGRRSIVAPNDSALAPASIVAIQPTLHMCALKLLNVGIQAQGRTGCLKDLGKISNLLTTFLKFQKNKLPSPAIVRATACNVLSSVFLVLGAAALGIADDCIPVFVNYFGRRNKAAHEEVSTRDVEQALGKLAKGKKRKRNVQVQQPHDTNASSIGNSSCHLFSDDGEEVAVATALVSMINQALVCCGGLIEFKNRGLLEGVLLNLIANFDDLNDTTSGKVRFLGALMDMLSTCMVLPYPGGSQSPVLGRALIFFKSLRFSGCDALSSRAFKCVAIAEALLHPRAPPLQHPVIVQLETANNSGHDQSELSDDGGGMASDRNSLLAEEDWDKKEQHHQAKTTALEVWSEDMERKSLEPENLELEPSLIMSADNPLSNAETVTSTDVSMQQKASLSLSVTRTMSSVTGTNNDSGLNNGSGLAQERLEITLSSVAPVSGCSENSQSGSDSDDEDFPEIVDGEPSDSSGEE